MVNINYLEEEQESRELVWDGDRYNWGLVVRIMGKVERKGNCWLWIGARTAEGYGRIWVRGKEEMVGRIVMELFCGSVLAPVFRSCGNASCISPYHLGGSN